MPSFTVTSPNLQAAGPIVDVRVTISTALENTLSEQEQPVPPPIAVSALIDTGATRTVIQEGISTTLNLSPVGIANINTPSSEALPCPTFFVRLVFPNGVVAEVVAVELPLKGQKIGCLIGRDVLAHGVLIYNGYVGQFTLSF